MLAASTAPIALNFGSLNTIPLRLLRIRITVIAENFIIACYQITGIIIQLHVG
jgi:hypothetical protein